MGKTESEWRDIIMELLKIWESQRKMQGMKTTGGDSDMVPISHSKETAKGGVV